MTAKIESLLEKYQANVYPAMLDDLAKHLGVSSQSLARLDLGWAPIVQFNKGPNFQGWWAIPERNADGEPVGISLRSQSDMKVMYPGSKHGLVYAINPSHERGGERYNHGASNWTRTMDAGILCPVCGKPDGCLVSSEDPDNPKAVICIRKRENAERPMRFGYLHILKEEGKVRSAPVLASNGGPVIVVEGMTDVAAAFDLGFDGIGRPSNLAGLDQIADLVRGRSVIILGENDKKANGDEPGREGMIAAFQVIKKTTGDVKMVMPPSHIKDLRAWVSKFGLDRDTFLSYVEADGQETTEQTVLADGKPLTIATAFLDSRHRMAGRYTLRYYRGMWYSWAGTRYKDIDPDEQIRGPLYGWANDKMVMSEKLSGESSIVPLMCNRHLVGNIMDAMLHPCPLESDVIPCWINGANGPDPKDLIAFENGLLWVSKYLAGAPESEYLLDPTPDFFNTFALPFPFDPTAKCPAWRRYLRSSLPDDVDKIKLLQEWFGYCMTPDISLHKLMLLRGPRRSGKGTALNVLQAVVGKDQCASTSFEALTTDFGLAPLVGKQVAIMGDAVLPRKADSKRALEVLLGITGGDSQLINRKNQKHLENHKLTTRFTIAVNELPELPDNSGALEARLNVIDFTLSFVGREDFGLTDKLVDEAPGIAIWALEGLRRLRDGGNRFTLPESSKTALREWRTTTSPAAAFVEECCDHIEDAETGKEELYDTWTRWSGDRGMRPMPKSRFYERLKANAPFAVSLTYEKGGHQRSVFKHIKLKRSAEERYLGRPRG